MSCAPGRKHNIFNCAQWTFKGFSFGFFFLISFHLFGFGGHLCPGFCLFFFLTAWAGLLYFIWIEEFGFILNGSRNQMLWLFWKEIFEGNSILRHWYFVSLWNCIVIIQGSTLSKKIFWCEKSKFFTPKMLKLDVSVFLTFFLPVFLLKHSYDFTKHPMFDKFWFSGSNFSKTLVAGAFYFYRTFRKSSDKTQLAAIGGTCAKSLLIIFAPLTHVCKHHIHLYMAYSCPFLIYCAVEHCTERIKFLFKKYSKYLLIFVSPSGTVTGEIRTGLVGWAQSVITRACAEPQLSSWQHSSTCTFASLHEANFKCNFSIRLIV